MDWQRINDLIEKYYAGQTSLKEEAEINKALNSEHCPEKLRTERHLFQMMAEASVYKSKQELQVKTKKSKRRVLLGMSISVAAAMALFFLLHPPATQPCLTGEVLAVVNNQEICDAKIAEQEAREALQFVSQKINYSTNQINQIK